MRRFTECSHFLGGHTHGLGHTNINCNEFLESLKTWTSPIAHELMRITNGRGVDYWVHSSGAHGLDTALACLSRCGHCAVIGDRDGRSIPLDVNVLKQRSLTVSAPVCFDYFDHRPYLLVTPINCSQRFKAVRSSPPSKRFP